MEVSSQFHALATLSLGKVHLVPIGEDSCPANASQYID